MTTSTIAFYSFILLLQVGVIFFYFKTRRKKKEAEARAAAVAAAPPENSHTALRDTALHVTPTQLKIAIPDTETIVYGVIMDWNMGETLMTLVTYITGAASMYLSSGGGVLGSGKNPTVGEAASEFVTMAQSYIYRAAPVTTFDLPPVGCVRFFLLTNHDKLAVQEQIAFFDNGTSSWLPLFEKANEVISEMRAGLN